VQRSRILATVRRKRWYTKPSDVRRIKHRKAIRRARRREWKRQNRQQRRRY
jgi:ribosomal protein S21